MKNFLSLVFAIVFTTLHITAEATQITGQAAKNYQGKMAYLYVYTDAISNKQILVAKSRVDENGNFQLDAELNATSRAYISVDRINANLFLEPNRSYSIAFPDLASNQLKSFGGTNQVDLVFYDLDNEDPNFIIGNFNQALDVFNRENVGIAFSNAYQKKALEFWRSAKTNYAVSEFVSNYVHFACANALLNGGLNKRKVFEYFLDSVQVDVSNPEFGLFIDDFFKNILEETDRISGDQQIKITLDVAPRAFKLLEELKRNDYLADLRLREIVALKGLQEIYPRDGYNKQNILDLINQLEVRTIYPEVKELAANIAFMLTWLKSGYQIPDFALEGYNGTVFRSSETIGKPTLYMFWAPWSKVALDELVNLNSRKALWGDKLNYVLISVGNSTKEDQLALRALGDIQATKLSYTKHPEIIDELQIISIPHFLLVDADGKIVRHFASSLDEISQVLSKMIK